MDIEQPDYPSRAYITFLARTKRKRFYWDCIYSGIQFIPDDFDTTINIDDLEEISTREFNIHDAIKATRSATYTDENDYSRIDQNYRFPFFSAVYCKYKIGIITRMLGREPHDGLKFYASIAFYRKPQQFRNFIDILKHNDKVTKWSLDDRIYSLQFKAFAKALNDYLITTRFSEDVKLLTGLDYTLGRTISNGEEVLIQRVKEWIKPKPGVFETLFNEYDLRTQFRIELSKLLKNGEKLQPWNEVMDTILKYCFSDGSSRQQALFEDEEQETHHITLSKTQYSMLLGPAELRKVVEEIAHKGFQYHAYVVEKLEASKVRLIANTNFETHIALNTIMARFSKILEKATKESTLLLGSESMALRFIQRFTYEGFQVPLDQSKFDHYVREWMHEDFFTILNEIEQAEQNPKYHIFSRIAVRCKEALSNNYVHVGKHTFPAQDGLLSGWKTTAVMGTLYNLAQNNAILTLMQKFTKAEDISPSYRCCCGDDADMCFSNMAKAAMMLYGYKKSGLKINISKFRASYDETEFFRNRYTFVDRTIHGYPARMIAGYLWKKANSINQHLTPSEYYEDTRGLERRGIHVAKTTQLLRLYLEFTHLPIHAWSEPDAIHVEFEYNRYFLKNNIPKSEQLTTVRSMLMTKTKPLFLMTNFESKEDAITDEQFAFIHETSYQLAQRNVVMAMIDDMMTEKRVIDSDSYTYEPKQQKEIEMDFRSNVDKIFDASISSTEDVESGGLVTTRNNGNGVLAAMSPLLLQMLCDTEAAKQEADPEDVTKYKTTEEAVAYNLGLLGPAVTYNMRRWTKNAQITWLTTEFSICGQLRKENALRYTVFKRIVTDNVFNYFSGKQINKHQMEWTFSYLNMKAEDYYSRTAFNGYTQEGVSFKY